MRESKFGIVAALATLSLFGACADDPTVRPNNGVPDGGIDGGPDAGTDPGEYEARFLIEHNAADDDTGFQIFFDWDPWKSLRLTGPAGDDVLEVEAMGAMQNFGLTEMFFETNEPPADEVSRSDVLSRFPPGEYKFDVRSVDDETITVRATLTHDIPERAEFESPDEDAEADPEQPLLISWSAVSQTLEGNAADIRAYQVIVGRDLEIESGEGFTELDYNVVVPASVTSLPVPAEYLRPGTPYEIEILVLEASGNQTISARAFETTGTPIDDLTEADEPGPTELAAAKFLIEHNATDDDTGYQIFLDGEPWMQSTVAGNTGVVQVRPQDQLFGLGLTEMFFETNEPAADEMSLADVLAVAPEGVYDFSALPVEGAAQMTRVANLTHAIPAATTIVAPAEAAEVDSTNPLAITWAAVTESIDGSPVDVVAYQVIVVKELDVPPQAGFFNPQFSVHVPADTTEVTVPAQFLEEDTEYEVEVLTIEASGNQTIALSTFATN